MTEEKPQEDDEVREPTDADQVEEDTTDDVTPPKTPSADEVPDKAG